QAAKKRDLKKKTSQPTGGKKSSENVLGGADYVSLMMGGRKKARQEAQKLPREA
ncbi:hypothetical protein PLICRDRAFT_107092, partial [Plicaturopsis crispa FD-325 SS-3]